MMLMSLVMFLGAAAVVLKVARAGKQGSMNGGDPPAAVSSGGVVWLLIALMCCSSVAAVYKMLERWKRHQMHAHVVELMV